MNGLAAALRDDIVSAALVRANAEVALVQWTGQNRQEVTIGWTMINNFEDADTFALKVAQTPRRWRHFSTAIGEALLFAHRLFQTQSHCENRVIDISGDGRSNEGIPPAEITGQLWQDNIAVNAVVIEGADRDLTDYFWENVIVGEGAFVETAAGFGEYPKKIRMKLRRETTLQLAQLRRARVFKTGLTLSPYAD